MFDSLTKTRGNRFWDRVGRVVARTGVSANQITWISTAFVIASAAAYAWHQLPLVFAVCITVFELFDYLDGAVARVTGTSSHEGAYLDALTDRYKEVAVIAALAWVHHAWPAALFALFGGMLTSYAKARAGMQVTVSNDVWPDLFERLERVGFLVVLLGAAAFIPPRWVERDGLIGGGLLLLGVGTNVSALQRFVRALRILRAHDRALVAAPAHAKQPRQEVAGEVSPD